MNSDRGLQPGTPLPQRQIAQGTAEVMWQVERHERHRPCPHLSGQTPTDGDPPLQRRERRPVSRRVEEDQLAVEHSTGRQSGQMLHHVGEVRRQRLERA